MGDTVGKKDMVVSVIVPIYKVEKYLMQCLESIINQTYTYLEIILVDDGSPDDCPRICDEFSHKDNRIRVVHKDNGGLSSARNAGIDICTGDLITFVDSDDWICLNAVELLVHGIEKNNADMCAARYQSIYKPGEYVGTLADAVENNIKCDSEDFLMQCYMSYNIGVIACSKIFKRSLFSNEIRFPVGMLYEDIVTTYRLAKCANNIAIIDSVIYNYRITNESITGSYFKQKDYDCIIQWEECRNWAKTDFPQMDGVFFRQLHSAHIAILGKMCTSDSLTFTTEAPTMLSFFKRNIWTILFSKFISRSNKLKTCLAICSVTAYKVIFSFYWKVKSS